MTERQRAKARIRYNRWRRRHPEIVRARSAQWRKDHPDYQQRQKWLKRYGVTGEQYDALIKAHKNRCAICKRPEKRRTKFGRIALLSVDHVHGTTTVRGLLCHSCNTGIGHFRDDPRLLAKAMKYLKVHRARPCNSPRTKF